MYEKSDKPSLVISTLEALAVLFSLMLFFNDVHPGAQDQGPGGAHLE